MRKICLQGQWLNKDESITEEMAADDWNCIVCDKFDIFANFWAILQQYFSAMMPLGDVVLNSTKSIWRTEIGHT